MLVKPEDDELLQRVRGQTGDLPWALRVVETEQAPAVPGGLRQAQALGEREDASVVIWLEAEDGGGWMVHVADVAHGRLLTRRVAPGPRTGPLSRSAGLEAAALVVRSALRSLAEGGEIGVAPPSPPPRVTAAPPRASSAPPPPSDVTHRWGVSAGWHGVKDTSASGVRHGPRLRLEWRMNGWTLGLRGDLGLPVSLRGEGVEVRLWRVAGMAVAGRSWTLASRWGLAVGLGVGTVVLRRDTERADVPLRGTDSVWLPRPAATVSAQLAWRVTSRLHIRLGAGVDGVLSAVRFRVEQPEETTRLGAGWPLQPWLAVSVAYLSAPL